MFNKNKILEKIHDSDSKLLLSKILDQGILCFKYNKERFTDFVDPYEQKVIKDCLNNAPEFNYYMYGGYGGAERQIISFVPDYLDKNDICYPISIIEVNWNAELKKLSHRDFLGSVLGLGIKREKIGDILVDNGICLIFCKKDIEKFILTNFNKVGSTKVDVKKSDIKNIKIPEKKFKEIHSTIASLRLDSIISCGLGESRTKVLAYIKAKKVNVNWEPCKSPSQTIKESDTISVKGKGRMIVDKIGKFTRKGRINIIIKRYT